MWLAAFSVSCRLPPTNSLPCPTERSHLAVVLLLFLYRKVKGRFFGRTENLGAQNRELGEEANTQQTFDDEKGETKEGPDPKSDVGTLRFLFVCIPALTQHVPSGFTSAVC